MKKAGSQFLAAGPAGFSLLELLVAVAVFSIISTLLYGTLSRTARSRQFAVEHEETAARARAVFTWLRRDLNGSFGIGTYPTGKPVFSTSQESGRGAFSEERWLLDFTTLSARGTTPTDVPRAIFAGTRDRGDQVRVLYPLEADPAESSSPAGRLLGRSEVPQPSAEVDLELATRSVIARAIDAVELRFNDGRQWTEHWNAGDSTTPPRGVEIELRVRAADGAVLPFVSAVSIPLGLRQNDASS